MIKRILIAIVAIVLVGSIYVALNAKRWAMAYIKKEISESLQTKSVTIKDLRLPLHGPIVLNGLVIKKDNVMELNVSDIVLDKGIWSVFSGSTGDIHIKSVLVNQLMIQNVHLNVWWHKQDLVFHILDGKILNGTMKGNAIFELRTIPAYQARLDLVDISLPKFINDFKLQKKLSLSGKVSGVIEVKGSGKNFSIIHGDLSNVDKGGELIIEDTVFLKQMVKSMKLDKYAGSEDLVVASLKHYLYNKLKASLNLEKGDLFLEATLEGDAGKRSFPIVYHDFNLERLGL